MKYGLLFLGWLLSGLVMAQDPASLMDEGRKLEQKLDDAAALEKYRQVIVIQPSHVKGLLKCAELSCAIGGRQATPEDKAIYYTMAKSYAESAWQEDSANYEIAWMMSWVNAKQAEVEENKEVYVQRMRQMRIYADKALAANAAYGRTYYLLGRWHFDLVSMPGTKRAQVKLLHGGLPAGSIDSAIAFMEKCRTMEPYYTQNFYDLGRTYQFHKKYQEAINVLTALQKLPGRRQSDVENKAAGAALLGKLQ